MNNDQPFVSILTPVYNGGKYIAECIESVLNQRYAHWEHIIVNNCSTDSTADIAMRYADSDPRIKIVSNDKFVNVDANHNIAFSLISPKSKYCKVVPADDWIKPDCIKKMVELAEKHPTVGIVGSYQLREYEVRWKGLPDSIEAISGREVCRLALMDNLDVFGNPTSLLYRSDLIRKHKPFFPHTFLYADTSACFKYLHYSDFGFVHEVLSIQRVHDQQESSRAHKLRMSAVADIYHLLEYGPFYLTNEEIIERKNEKMECYYRLLGRCMLRMEGAELWKFHSSRLKELGCPIAWRKVMQGAMAEIISEIKDPKNAFLKLLMFLKKR